MRVIMFMLGTVMDTHFGGNLHIPTLLSFQRLPLPPLEINIWCPSIILFRATHILKFSLGHPTSYNPPLSVINSWCPITISLSLHHVRFQNLCGRLDKWTCPKCLWINLRGGGGVGPHHDHDNENGDDAKWDDCNLMNIERPWGGSTLQAMQSRCDMDQHEEVSGR